MDIVQVLLQQDLWKDQVQRRFHADEDYYREKKKDDVIVVAGKDLWLYMASREVTGNVFFPCFREEN